MLADHRVVVTGRGVAAPNGTTVAAFWSSLLTAQSGINHITLFDASGIDCRVAGEVSTFDPDRDLPVSVKARRLSRQSQLAVISAVAAVRDAGLDGGDMAPDRVALVVGVSSSAVEIIERVAGLVADGQAGKLSPHGVEASQPHQCASAIAEHLAFVGRCITTSSACAAGLDAIGMAAGLISEGKADVVVAGGADSPVNLLTFASFVRAGLVPVRARNPQTASRPFDKDRESGVVSEGAAMVVLESREHARARGATVLAEITGYGTEADAPGAAALTGMAAAMQRALDNAGRLPGDVDYISAHGAGHPAMDIREASAIRYVFGADTDRTPVSSIKGVVGNPLAAAGPMQLVACTCAVQERLFPPTANLDSPDPDCALRHVRSDPLPAPSADCQLINAHGLGGQNASLVVEAPC